MAVSAPAFVTVNSSLLPIASEPPVIVPKSELIAERFVVVILSAIISKGTIFVTSISFMKTSLPSEVVLFQFSILKPACFAVECTFT